MIHTTIQGFLTPHYYDIGEYSNEYKEGIDSYSNSSGFDSLHEVNVGETRYSLLSSIDVFVSYSPDTNQWECHEKELSYIGISSESSRDAIKDFKSQMHIRFQQLYSKRTFEMTEDEHKEWVKLANTIDLLHYKITTPLKIREIGCVSYGRVSYPYRIKWLTDENYIIEPPKVPAELMSYKTGQWIEAIVEREPVTHKVLKISSVRRIRFHIPRSGETKKYWDNMEKIELKKPNG